MFVSKDMVIDMVVGGCSIPMGGITKELTPFTGNQWNEAWSWNRKKLNTLSLDQLFHLYERYKRSS